MRGAARRARGKVLRVLTVAHKRHNLKEHTMKDCRILDEVLEAESPYFVREVNRSGSFEKILDPRWVECIPLAIEILRDRYESFSEYNHRDAARFLGKAADYKDEIGEICEALASHEVVCALQAALKDDDTLVRINAARALWKICRDLPALLSVYEQALRSENHQAKLLAVTMIWELGPDAAPAVESLVSVLQGNDPLLAWHAAVALRKIGPNAKAAIPTLEAALRSDDKGLREAAQQAIMSIARE